MSEQERLAEYVAVWWQAVTDLLALLESLTAEEWSAPTDLPGWDVRAIASHVAHLEAILAGGEEETADVGEPVHVTGPMGLYTEIGVVTRRDRAPAVIVEEIRTATHDRHEALLADPPTDATARPEQTVAGAPWSWEVLLRNRPLDIWMHEQDVRRAVGRPGGMDTSPARHTADYLAETLGFVLAKKVGAPAGTTLVLHVAGSEPFAFTVNDAGRGERLVEPPAEPRVFLGIEREPFILLAGGRRAVGTDAVRLDGDLELGRRVLDQLATVP